MNIWQEFKHFKNLVMALSSEFIAYRELKGQYGTRQINELIGIKLFKEEAAKHGLKAILDEIHEYFKS